MSPGAVAQAPVAEPSGPPSAAGAGAGERPALRVGVLPDDFQLDGRLDEPAWGGAEAIEDLTTVEPLEGGVPSRRTVVRVLAGERAVVFGILCRHDDPGEIVSYSVGRDADLGGQDHVHVVIDTFRL